MKLEDISDKRILMQLEDVRVAIRQVLDQVPGDRRNERGGNEEHLSAVARKRRFERYWPSHERSLPPICTWMSSSLTNRRGMSVR